MADGVGIPTKRCDMVLRCHRRVWSSIVIQQQNARSEKSGRFFRITSFNSDSVSQYITSFNSGRVSQNRVNSVTPWFQPPKSRRKSKRFFRMQIPKFFLEGFMMVIERQSWFIHWVLGVGTRGPGRVRKSPDKLDLPGFLVINFDPPVQRGPVDLLRPGPKMSFNRHCICREENTALCASC
ncbi:hypothetical protein TNCV_4163471 [Trichonephila clavipes]|nr:hypothetical protein TNCV_4163471 [Trichonephila clavipes]